MPSRNHKSGIPSQPPCLLLPYPNPPGVVLTITVLPDAWETSPSRVLRLAEGKAGLKGSGIVSHQEEAALSPPHQTDWRTSQDFFGGTQPRKGSFSSAGNGIRQGERSPQKGEGKYYPESVQMKLKSKGASISSSSPGPFIQIIISIYAFLWQEPRNWISLLFLWGFHFSRDPQDDTTFCKDIFWQPLALAVNYRVFSSQGLSSSIPLVSCASGYFKRREAEERWSSNKFLESRSRVLGSLNSPDLRMELVLRHCGNKENVEQSI